MAYSTLNGLPAPGTPMIPNKPTVIGIYGISGSGKSYLLDYLKQELGDGTFEFYEGSDVIGSLVPGGLEAFKTLDEDAKMDWRRQAIEKICLDSIRHGTTAVVTGHFRFWSNDLSKRKPVYTKADMLTYTHIIYLDVPAQTVLNRCRGNTLRARPLYSVNDFQQWQESETSELRKLCRQNGILFLPVAESPTMQARVAASLRDFQSHSEESNSLRAQEQLDRIIAEQGPPPKTALVVDGDRTLTIEDTGALLWGEIAEDNTLHNAVIQRRLGNRPLKALFDGPLKYTYTAFRQAVLLCEEAVGDKVVFDTICDRVASRVTIHPEFKALLRRAAEQGVAVVVLTCGVRRVWEKVLQKEGLPRAAASVIGGGRILDGFVVDAQVKAVIVKRLRETYQAHVRAFGDSPLDLPMLQAADEAFVVVGELHNRSKTMDAALQQAVDDEGLKARQLLLPPDTATLRLDAARLPVIGFTTEDFIDALVEPSPRQRIVHATDTPAAKLLMAQMRNAGVYGPALQQAHGVAGRYLAIQFVSEQVGLETFEMRHVQRKRAEGHCLLHEEETTIVALMRGGEPMARGVYEAFPRAAFLHAKQPADIKLECLRGGTVLLVDGVVNTGKTVVEFREHLRALGFQGRIVVVAGVVQAGAVRLSGGAEAEPAGLLGAVLEQDPKVSVVALRLSNNEYKGKGPTDTGNRLFNTTFLD